jgi:hypothetical protein
LITFIFNIYSCKENVKEVKSNSINNNINNECFKKDSLDIENIDTENLNNLKLFNGIKFLKFGTRFQDAANCVKCKIISDKVKSCLLKDSLNYLNLKWSANLFFYEDLLTRIQINTTNPELNSVYDKLHLLFGKPNSRKFELVNSEQYKDNIRVKGDYEYCFKPIIKNARDYLYYFSEDRYLKRKNGNDYSKSHKFKIYTDEYESPQMRIKNVQCDFFSFADYSCEWNSDIILNLNTKIINGLNNYEPFDKYFSFPYINEVIRSEIIIDSDIKNKKMILNEINEYNDKINNKKDRMNIENKRKKEIEIIKQF